MIPVSLLIFDLDGTLVDTLDDITASVNHALRILNEPPVGRDEIRQFVGDGIEATLRRSLRTDTEHLTEAVALFKEHHRSNFAASSSLYPHVRETLEHFKSIPLAVISNKTTEFVQPLLRHLEIAPHFRLVIGADHGLPLKPAPDPVLRVLGELRVPRERAVLVGDGTADIRAGKAAGVITCAVTYGFRQEAELRALRPDYVIDDLADLKTFLQPEGRRH